MKKTKFKTGMVDIPEETFDPRDARIRISIVLEGDLLSAYKEAARHTSHGKYQTLMKEKLREALPELNPKTRIPLKESVRNIVSELLRERGLVKSRQNKPRGKNRPYSDVVFGRHVKHKKASARACKRKKA